MTGLPKSRVAALIVLGLFSGALAGAWHQHAFGEGATLPSASASLMCSLCAILHHVALQPESLASSLPLVVTIPFPSPQPQARQQGAERSPSVPRGPPVSSVA